MTNFPVAPTSNNEQPTARRSLRIWLINVLYVLSAIAPLLFVAWIELLAWRASILLGHWPIVNQDDPKFYIPADRLFDGLYYPTPLLLLWAVLSFPVFLLLSFLLWQKGARRFVVSCVVVYIIGWLVLRFAPSTAMDWYFD